MARKFIRRFMPDQKHIKNSRSLRFFGKWLHDPNLWHLNRHSIATAAFIGCAVAFVPLPIHTLLVTALAIRFRANLPLSLAFIWISNPVTIPAQFYMAYKFGALLLRQPHAPFHFELSLQWLSTEFSYVWQPLLLGCALIGLSAGVLAGALVHGLWRLQVILRWRARRRRRAASGL